jgi:hypothetical protein
MTWLRERARAVQLVKDPPLKVRDCNPYGGNLIEDGVRRIPVPDFGHRNVVFPNGRRAAESKRQHFLNGIYRPKQSRLLALRLAGLG